MALPCTQWSAVVGPIQASMYSCLFLVLFQLVLSEVLQESLSPWMTNTYADTLY